uniref:Uncharacterized protein n=1 Tax=Aegilops tauschii TaxID=37682 RepID=M8BMD3_AEGTA
MEHGKLPQHNPGKLEPSCRGGAGGRREGGIEKRAAEIFCQSRHQQGFAGNQITRDFPKFWKNVDLKTETQCHLNHCLLMRRSFLSVPGVCGLLDSGDLATQDKDSGRNFILSRFSLREMPNITFFGDMLISSDFHSEEGTFICFMVIAMSCFLFPSSSDQIHIEFLTLLVNPKRTSGFDFCALVYDWILTGINKFVISGRVPGRKPEVF